MKLDEQIKSINEKLQQLLHRFQSVKKENEKLRQELHHLKLADEQKTSQIQTLLQRVEILKAAKSQMSEPEKKAFEKRINQYLREIEKCITMIQE